MPQQHVFSDRSPVGIRKRSADSKRFPFVTGQTFTVTASANFAQEVWLRWSVHGLGSSASQSAPCVPLFTTPRIEDLD